MDPIDTGFKIDRVARPPKTVVAPDRVMHRQAINPSAQTQRQALFWPDRLLDPGPSQILVGHRIELLMGTCLVRTTGRESAASVISRRRVVLFLWVHQIGA